MSKNEKKSTDQVKLNISNSGKRVSRLTDSQKKKYRIFFIVGGTLIVLAVVLLVLSFCMNWWDSDIKQGHWTGKSREQIIADLNADVADGEMNVSIANTVKFENGSTNYGVAHIENIAANHVDQKVEIRLDGESEPVYKSGAIPPDHSIDEIKLNRELDPGVYKAVATFYGYDRDTHKMTGSVSAEIKIFVK